MARKMRRADDVATAATLFMRFWEQDGQAHFRVEEEVLLPTWARLGTVDQAAADQLAREHLRIRAAALGLAEQPDLDAVRELGRQLADHVRFEERQLFALIEADLGPDQLEQLARAVTEAEDRASLGCD